jgi:hypothetical protein
MDYETLKAYQRTHGEKFSGGLTLRAHRGLSWLNRAESARGDDDAEFIFLWIAFNAIYANDMGRASTISESQKFSSFLEKIVGLDSGNRIANLIWTEFSGDFRLLLEHHYVFQPFWDAQHDAAVDWKAKFTAHKKAALLAMSSQSTAKFLSILFANLYTLRNQIVHGGSTWNSRVNRDQVALGKNVLGKLVPLMLDIMMRSPKTIWGDAYYPVVD